MNRLLRTAVIVVGVSAVLCSPIAVSVTSLSRLAVSGHAGPTGRRAPVALPFDTAAVAAEAVYVPVTPCRIADTNGISGNVPPEGIIGLRARGSDFRTQGAGPASCGVPASATAVSLSLTAASATADGWIDVWPNGKQEPVSTVAQIYHDRHTTAAVTTPLSPVVSVHEFWVKVHQAGARLVVDVLGYYAPQMRADVNGDGQVISQSSRVLAVARSQTGTYAVTIDRPVAGCSAMATVANQPDPHNSASVYPSSTEPNQFVVIIWSPTSGGADLDLPFQFAASC